MKKLCLVFALALSAAGAFAQEAATLRVGLWTLWHDREITVREVQGGPARLRTCDQCSAVPLTQETRLRAEGSAIAFGDKHAAEIWLSGSLTLEAHGEHVALPYPVHVTARGGVLVMAVTMPVERYVERVVASESGMGDSDESLKALAVVVRSFALHVRHGHTEYDVCDATHCQLLHWGPTGRETAAHAAALRTAGETLWFHGRRAAAWFHQNCGGHTSAPAEVWGAKGDVAPWLVGRADPYCTAHGVREWSTTLTLEDLTRALADGGLVAPGWKTLAVAKRDKSGRAMTLMVGGTSVSAEDFRLAVGRTLGWNRIPSTWFEVSRSGDGLLFHGRGTGHGVGLCQAGAAAMAAQGMAWDTILAQYFPGAEVRDEASGLKWQSFERAGYMLETLEDEDQAYLPELDHALTEARSRSGLEPAGMITIRAFRSTPEFRAATLAPGWVAAFTENSWIGIQPLRTLEGRKMLEPVMRHEMLHALVESTAGTKAPLWLREGLVEAWSVETPGTAAWNAEKQATVAPKVKLEDVDHTLAHPASEAESEAAHAAARWYTQKLLGSYGRAQVIAWLRNGVPAQAMTAVQR
ncbi:SpoIID/LytB domain-containing protein [Terracidiphilus gabretensis]|uniref:SpoIID/LytB domain-containing protein n=1 Tax=Terracidiphilus gabretensis TaxID=1577687 RepID=UPI00071BF278|nr:SpoIID/LytB domain-containing protein [Terracidiphilus gabretensis]